MRRLHKAFLRYHDPNNWPLLREALRRMGRADLIGSGAQQLVPAYQPPGTGSAAGGARDALPSTPDAPMPDAAHRPADRCRRARRARKAPTQIDADAMRAAARRFCQLAAVLLALATAHRCRRRARAEGAA